MHYFENVAFSKFPHLKQFSKVPVFVSVLSPWMIMMGNNAFAWRGCRSFIIKDNN